MRRGKLIPCLVAVLATMLVLPTAAACGKRSGNANSGESSKTVTIGVLQGWAEDQVASELWKQVLTKKGYTVNLKPLSDAGPMFTGLADGDIDVFLDTWLPKTHKQYVDKYPGKFDDLGVWYANAKLTIAVPNYVDMTSIADLKGKSDQFDGKIVGIEPGAGLTAAAKDAISGYGLSGYTLQTSSTAGMLSSLKAATDQKKPIVVTLWRPHWAYSSYPVKDLTDPKGLMGATEKIHTYVTKGFGTKHGEVDGWLKNFTMTDDQLGSLEDDALNKHEDDPTAGVTDWIGQNPDFVKKMTS